ncbi:heme-copper oxidase subunit III [Haladaptatus sp. CMAA 1911]|uniref:cytochrome c oxidase subunit 3 n=1 Tax=unclassified Haladaptatus TaxID=2622732 RepID=UPI0037553AEA
MTDESTGTGPRSVEREKMEEDPGVFEWPYDVEETSVWPFVCASGVGTMYLGASIIVLTFGSDQLLPRWPGLILFFAGMGGFVTGLFGWVYQGFIYRYWFRGTDRHDTMTLRTAMVLFLLTEVGTFGGGFTYYFYVRAHPWPRGTVPELLSPILVINTALLVTSSVTMHYAHRAIQQDRHERFVQLLGITVLLGATFLAGQVYEYYDFIVEKGYTISSGIFASGFFGLTGLHGLHVTLGVLLLTIVLVRGLFLNQYSADKMTSISTVSMYWHFVDGVWLVLVTALYIGASLDMP